MKIIIKYIVAIIIFTTCLSAQAATRSPDLVNMLEAVKTMQADFTQIVYDDHGKSVQTSYGRMAMQRPGKFRWEVKKPIPQLIIANESRLWIYDPDLQQVTIRSLNQGSGGAPALLLSHVNSALDQDFVVKPLPKKLSAETSFELIPKQRGNMFASIQMDFTHKQISAMRLRDQLGHITLIRFADAKINQSLPPSLFNFKASAQVDVIDETRRH